jgi:hypothetical protein
MRTERIIEKESVWLWETEKNEKESKKLIETRPSWVKISSNFFLHISQKAESLSFEKMTLFFFQVFFIEEVFSFKNPFSFVFVNVVSSIGLTDIFRCPFTICTSITVVNTRFIHSLSIFFSSSDFYTALYSQLFVTQSYYF